jgi:hypothetical protein
MDDISSTLQSISMDGASKKRLELDEATHMMIVISLQSLLLIVFHPIVS